MTKELMIGIGYGIILLYIAVIMLVSYFFLCKKENLNKYLPLEFFFLGLSYIATYLFFDVSWHILVINLLHPAVVLLVHRFGFKIQKDKNYYTIFTISGSVVFLLSFIAVFLFDRLYIFLLITYLITLVGCYILPLFRNFSLHNSTKISGDKNIIELCILILCTFIIYIGFCYGVNLQYDILTLFAFVSLVAILYIYIPEKYWCSGFFFSIIYLLIVEFGYVTSVLNVAIIISLPLVVLSLVFDALTKKATLISILFLCLGSFFGGYTVLIQLITLYICAAVISKITGKIYVKRMGESKVHYSRNMRQILANGIMSFFFAGLYYCYQNTVFLMISVLVIAQEFADSMASDIGRLSRKLPIDIIKLKPIERGISGGVSILGSISAIIASFAGCAFAFIYIPFDYRIYLTMVAIAIVGVAIDSILGSTIQVLYKCPICEKMTEKRVHCGTSTNYYKGCKKIDNTFVNMLTNIITSLIALLLLLF